MKKKGKITGPQDFSGQDSGYPSASPEVEVAKNAELGGQLHSVKAHDISNSDRGTESHVLASDDPRLHLSRMSGVDAPNPSRYRGPDRRKI